METVTEPIENKELSSEINRNDDRGFSPEQLEQFFGWLKREIDVHYLQMKNNIARPEVVEFYTPFLTNDTKQIAINSKREADKTLAFMSAIEFMKELFEQETAIEIKKLAISFAGSKVLIWVEVNDEDYDTLQTVLWVAATVNARLDNGFTIRPTIVEKSDNLSIPPHYHPIVDKEL